MLNLIWNFLENKMGRYLTEIKKEIDKQGIMERDPDPTK